MGTRIVAITVALLCLVLCCSPAWARGGRRRPMPLPDVVEKKVKSTTSFSPVSHFVLLTYRDNPLARGWLQEAFERKEDEKYELLVSLHGAGADPFGFLYSDVACRRKCFVLIVAGSAAAPRPNAANWNDSDKAYVAGLTHWVREKYPVDNKKVVLMGHSRGGYMAWAVHTHAPHLYTGVMTTASAGSPGPAQYGVRCVGFFGKRDPNLALASSYRTNFEHKKRRAAASLRIVKDLGHEIPEQFYVDQAIEWILSPNARGAEVILPKTPPVRRWLPYAHVLVRYRGSRNAGDRAARTTKKRAQAEVKLIKKYLDHKKAYAHILMEAAAHSHDDKTAPSGGLIELVGLAAFSPDLKAAAEKLEHGKTSAILESPEGFHVIYRFPKTFQMTGKMLRGKGGGAVDDSD